MEKFRTSIAINIRVTRKEEKKAGDPYPLHGTFEIECPLTGHWASYILFDVKGNDYYFTNQHNDWVFNADNGTIESYDP